MVIPKSRWGCMSLPPLPTYCFRICWWVPLAQSSLFCSCGCLSLCTWLVAVSQIVYLFQTDKSWFKLIVTRLQYTLHILTIYILTNNWSGDVPMEWLAKVRVYIPCGCAQTMWSHLCTQNKSGTISETTPTTRWLPQQQMTPIPCIHHHHQTLAHHLPQKHCWWTNAKQMAQMMTSTVWDVEYDFFVWSYFFY